MLFCMTARNHCWSPAVVIKSVLTQDYGNLGFGSFRREEVPVPEYLATIAGFPGPTRVMDSWETFSLLVLLACLQDLILPPTESLACIANPCAASFPLSRVQRTIVKL